MPRGYLLQHLSFKLSSLEASVTSGLMEKDAQLQLRDMVRKNAQRHGTVTILSTQEWSLDGLGKTAHDLV